MPNFLERSEKQSKDMHTKSCGSCKKTLGIKTIENLTVESKILKYSKNWKYYILTPLYMFMTVQMPKNIVQKYRHLFYSRLHKTCDTEDKGVSRTLPHQKLRDRMAMQLFVEL